MTALVHLRRPDGKPSCGRRYKEPPTTALTDRVAEVTCGQCRRTHAWWLRSLGKAAPPATKGPAVHLTDPVSMGRVVCGRRSYHLRSHDPHDVTCGLCRKTADFRVAQRPLPATERAYFTTAKHAREALSELWQAEVREDAMRQAFFQRGRDLVVRGAFISWMREHQHWVLATLALLEWLLGDD